jgi:hypothetical protein
MGRMMMADFRHLTGTRGADYGRLRIFMMEHLMQGSGLMETAVRLVILFQVFPLVACSMPEEGVEIGTSSQSISFLNGMSMNGMSMNGMSMNGIIMSDVVNDGLSSLSAETLASTQEGAAVLPYLVRCALPESDSVAVLGVTYEGLFGVAPDWKDQPLVSGDQEAVTACLLAHVNNYDISVWLSGRVHGLADTTADERQRFSEYEGSFYGNIFSVTQYAYACMGKAAPDFSVAYPNHDTTEGDRLMRRCTDPSLAVPGQTECGMIFAGKCSEVCDTAISGSHSNCWPDATRAGTQYPHTMSTWLLRYDDADSTWPIYYDTVYGS